MEEKELAYKRKARLRGKNRKVTIESIASPKNLDLADKKARKGKANHKGVKYTIVTVKAIWLNWQRTLSMKHS